MEVQTCKRDAGCVFMVNFMEFVEYWQMQGSMGEKEENILSEHHEDELQNNFKDGHAGGDIHLYLEVEVDLDDERQSSDDNNIECSQ